MNLLALNTRQIGGIQPDERVPGGGEPDVDAVEHLLVPDVLADVRDVGVRVLAEPDLAIN